MSRETNSKKYQVLLREGKILFWKHGIRRVSVLEICKQAAVSKMTFYRFFENKTALAKALIDRLMIEGIADYNKVMSQNIPFSEKVQQHLLQEQENSKGLSKELLMDLYANPESELTQHLMAHSLRTQEIILADYAKAQEEGEIRADIKLEFIQYYLQQIQKMIADPQLHALYPDTQELVMELSRFFFYGLSNPENQNK